MAKRGFDSTDMLQFLNYAWPVCGIKAIGDSTTCTVALATIEATDVVLAYVSSAATVCYALGTVITAGTGFITTVNTTPGGTGATVSYLVFKKNY